MNKKDRLICAHIDLDGISTFVMLKYFDIPYNDVIFMNYSDYEDGSFDYSALRDYNEVWYTDFSPDEQSLDILKEESVKVKVLDHHQSFFDLYQSYDNTGLDIEYIFDNERCGTKILFDYLRGKKRLPKSIYEFVALVNVYDLWKEKADLFEIGQNLNRLFWKSLDYRFKGVDKYLPFANKTLEKLKAYPNEYKFLRTENRIILGEKKKEMEIANEAMRSMLVRKDSLGATFGIVKLKKKISIVAHKLLKARSNLDFLIIINTWDKDEPRLSLRSKEFNLLKLEGASGHENSCGMKDRTKEFIEDLWKGRIYELDYKEETTEAEK